MALTCPTCVHRHRYPHSHCHSHRQEGALGAVVMVLEGCEMSKIYAAWSKADGAAVEYPVAELDEEFSAFFSD